MEYKYLTHEEIPLLTPLMEGLAEYHNRTARDFAGMYPVIPIAAQLKYMAYQVEKGDARAEAVLDGGEIVGFCTVSHGDGHGELDILFLKEEYRGRGIGERLLENGLAWLREQGVGLIDLRVVEGNPAQKFYEKFGFRTRSLIMSLKP